jgi:hypothetical protein
VTNPIFMSDTSARNRYIQADYLIVDSPWGNATQLS